jgi:hypothetical protein
MVSIKKRTVEKTQHSCPKGHKYLKSTDCPTCPVCEDLKKPENGWLAALSAPSRRAMEAAGIKTLKQLSGYTEKEIAGMHGVGPKVIRIMSELLKKENLNFKS